MVKILHLFAGAAGAAAAGAAAVGVVELEPQHAGVPVGWQSQGRAKGSAELELIFAVKQTNLDKLHDTLSRVSDPRHADYGRHLSNDEVHALVAPAPASLGAVRAFLAAHGVASDALTPNGDFLRAIVPSPSPRRCSPPRTRRTRTTARTTSRTAPRRTRCRRRWRRSSTS